MWLPDHLQLLRQTERIGLDLFDLVWLLSLSVVSHGDGASLLPRDDRSLFQMVWVPQEAATRGWVARTAW